ncbi:hypothetical protein [Halobacillus salinus]|uniref:hypothetical protein n=1 Tax=Halobacillus salinus TaxID=192814 RepID=UPI0009A8E105|nr:hypothetical protein [Halobacillus salinus]
MEMRQTDVRKNQVTGAGRFPFTKKQTGLLTMLGLGFWFLGAMTVKFGAQVGLFGPVASIFAFALGIAVAWVGVKFMISFCKLEIEQIVPGVAFGLGVATFSDGIAITWFTSLYGNQWEDVGLGAAWILWGAFTFLAAAFLEAYKRA